MKNSLIIIAVLFAFAAKSQSLEASMNVTNDDLSLSVFEKDLNAEAVIAYDYGNAFYHKRNWILTVEFKRKIKILTDKGLSWGQLEIPLYIGKNSRESIADIVVKVHNLENGKVTISSLEQNAIYRTQNENWEIVKVVFPNVKIGSVITYSYTKETNYMRKFVPWNFQHNVPTIYSEFNASIPGNYNYNIKLSGTIPLSVNTNSIDYNCLEAGGGGYANCSVYKYAMENIPAYRAEKYSTNRENYLSKIEYELKQIQKFDGDIEKFSKSWKEVDKDFNSDSNFGKQISRERLVKDVLPDNISKIENKLEKATAIFQFVLDNYSWNNKSGRYDTSIKRLLEDKKGNAFEINLLLQNLLHAEDYTTYPVLLSTRDNGLATKIFPVASDFDFVITKLILDDEEYYLDATNPYIGFGDLSFICLNQYGRVFDSEYGSYWEDIEPKSYSTTQIGAKFKLSEDNKLVGKLSTILTGYNSLENRKMYYDNPSEYSNYIKNSYINANIENHEVILENKNSEKFSEEFDITYESEFIAGKIYLNPFIHKLFDENPFKLQQRTYPIDYGFKQAYLYAFEIDLGEKLKVLELPEPVLLSLPNKAGNMVISFTSSTNKLSVFAKITLDKAIYPTEYYEALKTFISKVIDIQKNTIIVLEKS